MMRSVVWSMSASCGLNQKLMKVGAEREWETFVIDERRMPVWGWSGVPVSRRSCGSLRPEAEGSHAGSAPSIDVDAVAANAEVANKAVSRIAAARSEARSPR